MRLLKIIFIIFGIYFVRRFIQLYRAMKRIQDERVLFESQKQTESRVPRGPVIDADFKVLD